jgi:hypothetical protein
VLRVDQQALEQQVSDPAGRIICFVRRKELGEELVDYLSCYFYHANMSDRDTRMVSGDWLPYDRGDFCLTYWRGLSLRALDSALASDGSNQLRAIFRLYPF